MAVGPRCGFHKNFHRFHGDQKVAVLLLEPQHKTKWVTTEKSPSANPKLTNELFDQSSYYWLNRLILRCYRSSRNYSGMSSFLLL